MYRAVLTEQPYPVKGLITFGTDLLMGNGDPLRGKAALEAWTSMCMWTCAPIPVLPWLTCCCPPPPAGSAALRPSLGTGAEMATWAQLREPVVQPLHESRSEARSSLTWPHGWAWASTFDGDIEAAYGL